MSLIPEFKVPEVATVIRWLLRVILVAFLAWVVRRNPEQEDEGEQETEEAEQQNAKRAAALKSRARPPASNDRFRQPPRRQDTPYPNYNSNAQPRQRRPVASESMDFDSIIDKMSKPKEMWEVRKGGEPPQIIKRNSGSLDTTGENSSTEVAPSKVNKAKKKDDSNQLEDANSLLKKTVLHGHTRPVTFITWNSDGNLIFTCSKDKKISVWSFPEGECLGSYDGHQGAVWACSVTSDSSWLVTSGADRLVLVWEARTSRELARTEMPGVVRFVEWASGGNSSASGEKRERFVTAHNKFASHPPALTVHSFDGVNIEEQLVMNKLPTAATQVRWARENLEIVSSHENGELVFWKADDGAEVRRIQAHNSALNKFDFSVDRQMVATASTDKTVKVWDLAAGSEGKLLFHAETDRPLNAVALGPLTRDAVVSASDKEALRCCFAIAGGGQDVRDVALTSGSSDQFDTLLFRLGDSSELPRKMEADGSAKGHFGPVHTLAFTADGRAMASGSEDGCVRLHMFASRNGEAAPEGDKQ